MSVNICKPGMYLVMCGLTIRTFALAYLCASMRVKLYLDRISFNMAIWYKVIICCEPLGR